MITCDALVDTGAVYTVLPKAWKQRIGKITTVREIDCETVTQETVNCEVCGPVEIKIECSEPLYSDLLMEYMNH